jgi:hypothetical protein
MIGKIIFWYRKYSLLVWFVAITFIVLLIGIIATFYKKGVSLWDLLSALDTATAIALAVLAFFAYLEYARGEDEIKIYLNVEGEKKDTQLRLLRKQVSRSEVLGILGMIQNKNSGRFENSKFRNKKILLEFLNNIMEVQKGNKDEIEVPISKEDFDKYFSDFFKDKATEKEG